VVQREAGRVGATVLAPVEHRDESLTELVTLTVLVEDPGYSAHALSYLRVWGGELTGSAPSFVPNRRRRMAYLADGTVHLDMEISSISARMLDFGSGPG
jgi:hypothetical protein